MLPDGFENIATVDPPLWEDVTFVLDDGRQVEGYFTYNRDDEGECRTNDERVLKNVIGWKK